MARYKPRDYSQTQLAPGTLEHTIHYVVGDRLDHQAGGRRLIPRFEPAWLE